MKRNRTILLALLVPLLLELLVFFSVAPVRNKDFQARLGQPAEEVCDAIPESEVEENLEETVEFLYAGSASGRQAVYIYKFGCSRRVFHTPSARSSLLASGWSMPLRI